MSKVEKLEKLEKLLRDMFEAKSIKQFLDCQREVKEVVYNE